MNEEEVLLMLEEVLKKDPRNYSRILELSLKLASFDENHVRFSVDAGIIDRLGKELVARHETAVSELVKNSYDADSTFVRLTFINTDNPGGILVIEDDGHGMTKEQIVNGFMRISSSDKIHHPVSPKYHRIRAGRKGIGRFAAQRLGNELTIITRTNESDHALEVKINWNQFDIDKDIMSISNSIRQSSEQVKEGTTLIIEGLREWWSGAAIKRVYRYSMDIIQPFPISKKTKETENDPGFTISCFKSIDRNIEKIADEDTMIFDHALAEITGHVDSEGKATWNVNSKKLNLKDDGIIPKFKKEEESTFEYLREISFTAYYYIYNIGMIPKVVEGYIREKANEYGGIRIYRNGFRVLPYGEPQNDWLGLDESVRRRTLLPQHGNNNLFGFVEISGKNSEVFNELSSREGLFKNDAYDELVDFVYRAILSAVLRIAEFRDIKQTTSQKDWVRQDKPPAESVKEVANELEQLANEFDENGEEDKQSGDNKKSKRENTGERFRKLSDMLKLAAESLEELGMLRVLAGLGITIGEFTHEIKQYLPAFDVDTNYLVETLEKSTEEFKRSLRLKESFGSFKTYAAYFDETISQNIQRELRLLELRDIVNSFKRVIGPDLERNGYEMLVEFRGYDLFTCKMHPSEWASILFNLYSNSKKAIKRAKTPGKLLICAGKYEEKVYLEFSDNGDGIPVENQDKIFNAFFTTSSQMGHSANRLEELTGTGLGLKIIKDIVEGYGGEIFLTPSPNNYVTTFRIEIPKASEREISEYEI
ncbi:MAG: ATP-binding protein [Bacteroidales bacterium]|nr:ATP-binding protein [Bacteroidales bacterium]